MQSVTNFKSFGVSQFLSQNQALKKRKPKQPLKQRKLKKTIKGTIYILISREEVRSTIQT